MTVLTPSISLHHTIVPSPLPTAPSFHLHLTRLRNTLMIWIGTGPPTDVAPTGEVSPHPQLTSPPNVAGPSEKRLAADWGVAMPALGRMPVTGTPVFRSGAMDVAVPMSQRLARRFPQNQIHLSLSLPASLTESGSSAGPFPSKVMLMMEKRLCTWIEEVITHAR